MPVMLWLHVETLSEKKMKMKTLMKMKTKKKRKDLNTVMEQTWVRITARSQLYITALTELIDVSKSISSTVPWGSSIYLPTLSGLTTVSLSCLHVWEVCNLFWSKLKRGLDGWILTGMDIRIDIWIIARSQSPGGEFACAHGKSFCFSAVFKIKWWNQRNN